MITEPRVMEIARDGGQVFIDVGANTGEYSLKLWRKYKTILALEPYTPSFDTLREKFGWRSIFCNFLPVHCAADEIDGLTYLFLDANGQRCNGTSDTTETVFAYAPLSKPHINKTTVHHPGDGSPNELVACRRLDTLTRQFQIDSVDFLKIDVEGSEFKVLNGASQTLEKTKRIVVELHDRKREKELETRILKDFNHFLWLDPDHIYGFKQ